MTVTELIARAAKRLIDGDPQLLGVRVCPVTVSPGEVEPLRKELQKLAKSLYDLNKAAEVKA